MRECESVNERMLESIREIVWVKDCEQMCESGRMWESMSERI